MAWTTMAAPVPVGQLTIGVTEQGVGYLSFGGGLRSLPVAARSIGARLCSDDAWHRVSVASGVGSPSSGGCSRWRGR